MKRLGCLRIEILLERRAAGLSEADRLVLEEHLSGCVACRDDARTLDVLASLVREEPAGPLSPSTHRHVVRRALREATAPSVGSETASPIRAPRMALVGLAVAAAVAIIALLPWTLDSGETRWQDGSAVSAPDDAPLGARLLAGEIAWEGSRAGVGGTFAPFVPLFTTRGAQLEVAHARVDLSPGGRVLWDPLTATLTLYEGMVRVALDPAPGRRVRIATARFVVEAIGTQFEVDLGGARVADGVIRVLDPAGTVLVQALTAGQAWEVAPVIGAAIHAAGPAASSSTRSGAVARKEGTKAARPGAAATLDLARRRLAAGDVGAAREQIARVLAAGPTRREEAEARTLLAECALVAGDPLEASRLYQVVARRYPKLSAGENALFAAARLEANAGRASSARELLRTYLERYPDGRFRKEAASRLRSLDEE